MYDLLFGKNISFLINLLLQLSVVIRRLFWEKFRHSSVGVFQQMTDSHSRPGAKPCRACVDFKSWIKLSANPEKKEGQSSSNPVKKPVVDEEHKPSDCPLDKDELGRSSWGFLHTMAANYPEYPSETQKTDMKQFMGLFAKFYPCDFCAKDMREDLKTEPPDASSQATLSSWLCNLHNRVNTKMGKEEFDCSKVNERWRDGWNDGSCG